MPACSTAERDTIGTDETLNAATAEGLRAFYRRWYRPDRATIVMVGDADPEMMEELIRARFGGWRAEGPAPAEPDYGSIAEVPQPVANLAYPGAPTAANLVWMRPYEAIPHTMARERLFLEEMLAAADHQPPARGACARRNPPSSAPRSARRARATSPIPPQCRSSRATAIGAAR